jgi:hypothetical protein
MPAGREIIIAREKPNAMTTNNALIFLLDKFLPALVMAPKSVTLYFSFFNQRAEEGQQYVQLENNVPMANVLQAIHCCRPHVNSQLVWSDDVLLNRFSELHPILFSI